MKFMVSRLLKCINGFKRESMDINRFKGRMMRILRMIMRSLRMMMRILRMMMRILRMLMRILNYWHESIL